MTSYDLKSRPNPNAIKLKKTVAKVGLSIELVSDRWDLKFKMGPTADSPLNVTAIVLTQPLLDGGHGSLKAYFNKHQEIRSIPDFIDKFMTKSGFEHAHKQ